METGVLMYGPEPQAHMNIKVWPHHFKDWLELGEPFIVRKLVTGGWVETAYTARCERSRGKGVRRWYGYKRIKGKLIKRYLGTIEAVYWGLLERKIKEFC